MYVIEVIPLLRATTITTLSYYSAVSYPIGTFLQVPIRKKSHRAIVTKVTAVADNKTSLRQASFTLQKLPTQENVTSVPESIRATAEALTDLYPATTGALLYHLLPPELHTGEYQFPAVSSLKHQEDTIPQVLTLPASDRLVAYRSHLRSVLAKRGSVMFVAPTGARLEEAYTALSAGITDRIVKFTPQQSKTERRRAYEAFEDTSVAKVIFTTPSHAYLDRVDLLSIVIEEESSDFYCSRRRPYLDHRVGLTTHAALSGRSLILGDILPRSETEHRRRQEWYSTYDHEPKRHALPAPLTIIEQKDKPTAESPFQLFSNNLKSRIESTLSQPGRVFLFGARKGLAPVVACLDCGHIFRCPDSRTPYSLLKTYNQAGVEERWFVSSTSGRKERAADVCTECGSWRLRERGIGVQTVANECETLFPNIPRFLFDQQTASTKKKAEGIIDAFLAERQSILIGTQLVIPYLYRANPQLSAVVSMDATRSAPTWQADEKTLRLLLELRERTEQEVLVQTRSRADDLLTYAKTGTIETFYTEELALRESLSYPPFALFILLTWRGESEVVKRVESEILSVTTGFSAQCYNNPLSSQDDTIRHALFRLPAKDAKNATLIKTLSHLPPYVRIEINPSRIV